MRARIAIASLAAVGLVALGGAPPSSARDDPNASQTKKLEKNAAKQIGSIVKVFSKGAKKDAAAKAKDIKEFTQALKSGKRIVELSGVSQSGSEKVSEAQALALVEKVLQLLTECQGGILAMLRDAYSAAQSNATIRSFLDSPSSRAVGGVPGAVGEAPSKFEDGWEGALKKLLAAVAAFQTALADRGVLLSFTNRAPATLNPLSAGVPLAGPYLLGTGSVSNGNVYAIVTQPSQGSTTFDQPDFRVGLRTPDSGLGGGLVQNHESPGEFAILYDRRDSTMDRLSGTFEGGPGSTRFSPAFERNEPVQSVLFRTIDNSFNGGSADNVDLSSSTWISIVGPCDPPPDPRKEALVNLLELITDVPRTQLALYSLDELNEVFNSNLLLARIITGGVIDAIFGTGAVVPESEAQKIGRLDASLFPCGAGPNGFTICANIPAPDPGGDMIVIGVAYTDELPLNDNNNLYQYGFVFDQDGNAGNNYTPGPQFAGDYFQDTDKWYAAEYAPSTGWELKVTDARNGGFVPVASAARVIISGNAMVLAVPASEFATANPSYRTTSFRHTGDFGQNPPFDWTADYDPVPGEELRPLPAE